MRILEQNDYHLKPVEPTKITCHVCHSVLLVDDEDWLNAFVPLKSVRYFNCPNCTTKVEES